MSHQSKEEYLESYQNHHGPLSEELKQRLTSYSARTLERITAPVRATGEGGRRGRKTGRTSHRLKTLVPVQCGPQEVDRPGYLEADTVSHGGSSSGEYLNSLTLTDLHSGWTELAALWGNRGSEVRVGLEEIESRMPFDLLGFDCDHGSEFLNEVLENYLLNRRKNKVRWTRSRPYKKNDQAHVEQKNFTHVRQLLGYGRFDDLELKELVDDLYQNAWLPLRNYFTPAMKLIEKRREGSRVTKKYDEPKTPCDRLLD